MTTDNTIGTTNSMTKSIPLAIILDHKDNSNALDENYLTFIKNSIGESIKGDLCVISNIGSTTIVQGWKPLDQMNSFIMTLGGQINVAKATAIAVEKIKEQMNYYKNSGIEAGEAYIMLWSNVNAGNLDLYKQEISRRTADMRTTPHFLYMNGRSISA